MKEMSLPGFTAAVTLNKTREQYRKAKTFDALEDSQQILPQLRPLGRGKVTCHAFSPTECKIGWGIDAPWGCMVCIREKATSM